MKFSTPALLAVAAFAAKASAEKCEIAGPPDLLGGENGFGFGAFKANFGGGDLSLGGPDNDLDGVGDGLMTDVGTDATPLMASGWSNTAGCIAETCGTDGCQFDCSILDSNFLSTEFVTITHKITAPGCDGGDTALFKSATLTVRHLGNGAGSTTTAVTATSSDGVPVLLDMTEFVTDLVDGQHGVTPEKSFIAETVIELTPLSSFATGPTITFDQRESPNTNDYWALDYSRLDTVFTCECPTSDTAPDPHFKTFSGDWFDFHGQCDLVLIDVPDYDNETGLSVNIRTTVRYAYSFIETVAIQVGEDILQVSGWGDYMINGISNVDMESATLNGRPVRREIISDKQSKFVVDLENGHHFTIKVFKDMISTSFDLPEEHDVRGILGDRKGAKLARDGVTIMEDANEFGQEWQVQDTDHQLFQTVRAPQFPAQCIMPDPVEREQRRLAATVSQDAAEAACSHVKDEHVRDMCIFDVMSVDDLSLAAGAY